ncbi:nuclear pore complex protein Nup107-like [Corticium candelabrum]|uniref:nuclear pore complex protein Nup107-like n=1 Tax=Corticium candelabrum TaxID=121492 RepID=UPI002E256811|nr:nuclear pore complex protein Nup107-like [Corticium candelabrum]
MRPSSFTRTTTPTARQIDAHDTSEESLRTGLNMRTTPRPSATSRLLFGPQTTGMPSPALQREEAVAGVMRRRSSMNRSLRALEEAILTPQTHTLRTPSFLGGSTARTSAAAQSTPYDTSSSIPRHQLSFSQLGSFGGDVSLDGAAEDDDATKFETELPSAVEETRQQFNTIAFAPEEHPASTAIRLLFDEFHLCLKSYPLTAEVLDLVHSYEEACQKAWQSLDKSSLKSRKQSFVHAPKQSTTYNTGVLLREERNSWRLIYSLYKDLLSVSGEDEMMDFDTPSCFAYSEKNIVESLYRRDRAVRLQQVVVDWLEKCAEEDMSSIFMAEFAADSVCYERTLHELNRIDKPHGQQGCSTRLLVTEIDPDAPHRQGRHLVDGDEEDEADLIRNIYFFIRAGRLDEAQKLCNRAGQPWRAAALEGWRLWHDPNYYKDSADQPQPDERNNGDEILPVEGNPYRDLWKCCSWALAEQTQYSQYERAVYACLSGNLEQILPVCSSWSDYLWAYYKTMIDVTVEQEIFSYPRPDRIRENLPDGYWMQRSLTPEDVFERIERYNTMSGQLNVICKYRSVQKNIILNDMDSLSADIRIWLADTPPPPHHFLRFLAHLVLFLRSVGIVGGDDSVCNSVLVQYVEGLIREKQSTLVATYTASLMPDERVSVYAKFLEGITDTELKKECLKLAEKAGLNVQDITRVVMENIRNIEQEDFTLTATYVAPLETDISEVDKKKVAAIDWLMFEPSQRYDALMQSNAIIRGFLATGKLSAARDVFTKIPKDSIEVVHQQWRRRAGKNSMPVAMTSAVREHLCVKMYLDANDAFHDWFQRFHAGIPTAPAATSTVTTMQERMRLEHELKKYNRDVERWSRDLQEQTGITVQKIYDVLLFDGGGWMREDEGDGDENRRQQLCVLRQLCLPGMVFLLHQVLHSTRRYAECVQLADIVASESYQLYKVFRQDELQKFLQLVHNSSVEMLDGNVDPLGYSLV